MTLDLDSTVSAYLTLVQERRDVLSDGASASARRLALLASEIEQRRRDHPVETVADGLAGWLGVQPDNAPESPHVQRQLAEIVAATAILEAGASDQDAPVLLVGLKACRSIATHPPKLDSGAVLRAYSLAAIGEDGGLAPLDLCASDEPPDDESEET